MKTRLTFLLLVALGLNASWLWRNQQDLIASQIGYYKIETADLAATVINLSDENESNIDQTQLQNKINKMIKADDKLNFSGLNMDQQKLGATEVILNTSGARSKSVTPTDNSSSTTASASNSANSNDCKDGTQCKIKALEKQLQTMTDEQKATLDELQKLKSFLSQSTATSNNDISSANSAASNSKQDKKDDETSAEDVDFVLAYALRNGSRCFEGAGRDAEDVTLACAIRAFESQSSRKDAKKSELKDLFDKYIKTKLKEQISDADDYSDLTEIRRTINSLLGRTSIAKSEIKKSLLALRGLVDVESAKQVKSRFDDVDGEYYSGEDARDFAQDVLADLEGKDSIAIKKLITNLIAKYDKSKLDQLIQEKYYVSQDLSKVDPATASLLLREFQVDRLNFLNSYRQMTGSLQSDFISGLEGGSRGIALNEFRNSYLDSMNPYVEAFKLGKVESLNVPRLAATMAASESILNSVGGTGTGLTRSGLTSLGQSRFSGLGGARLNLNTNFDDRNLIINGNRLNNLNNNDVSYLQNSRLNGHSRLSNRLDSGYGLGNPSYQNQYQQYPSFNQGPVYQQQGPQYFNNGNRSVYSPMMPFTSMGGGRF